jgi:Rrf2 family protein
MIELGLHDNKTGVFQKDIAKNQELSEKYLDVIIASLKTAGLIRNAAGKKSGYILNKPPSRITVYNIFRAFEPGPDVIQSFCNPCMFNNEITCPAHDYWSGLNQVLVNYMKSTTLNILVSQSHTLIDNIANLAAKKKSSKKK